MRIECQGCGAPFKVAFSVLAQVRCSTDAADELLRRPGGHIDGRTLGYGDPPNMNCCDAGPSMSGVPRKVPDYWVKPGTRGRGTQLDPGLGFPVVNDPRAMDIVRDPALERDIMPDRAQ